MSRVHLQGRAALGPVVLHTPGTTGSLVTRHTPEFVKLQFHDIYVTCVSVLQQTDLAAHRPCVRLVYFVVELSLFPRIWQNLTWEMHV